MPAKIQETDLYPPIQQYFQAQGYTVRGEVKHCDLTAVKEERLVIIELKCTMNIKLLTQAIERQRITDWVYVAVPKPKKGLWSKEWRQIQHLVERLELGLIIVSFAKKQPEMEILFHPKEGRQRKNQRRKKAILQEIHEREGDYNAGGSTRQKLVTAYREKAIHIACWLEAKGEMSPRDLKKLGTDPKTRDILYDNHYNWFERVSRGVYRLTDTGRQELDTQVFKPLTDVYRQKLQETQSSRKIFGKGANL